MCRNHCTGDKGAGYYPASAKQYDDTLAAKARRGQRIVPRAEVKYADCAARAELDHAYPPTGSILPGLYW